MIQLKQRHPENYQNFLRQFKEETEVKYETLPTWSQLKKQSKNAGTPGKAKMHADEPEFPEGNTDAPVVSETKEEVSVENENPSIVSKKRCK